MKRWVAAGIILASVLMTGCQSDEVVSNLRSENLNLKIQVKDQQKQFQTTKEELQKQYDHAKYINGDLELRLMSQAQQAPGAMVAHMLSMHLSNIMYQKDGQLAEDGEPFTYYRKLASPWYDEHHNRLYYSHVQFVNPIELTVNDHGSQTNVKTQELWLIPDPQTHRPVFYFKNGSGKYDVYKFAATNANDTYDWNTWIKGLMDYDEKFVPDHLGA